ncbi:hypothetical protein Nepgr_012251 [Nepenthes gracilis]|uniref:Reverse transcriptase Ty1/copia-type domain-containing protein n=1 Tax=Nepenthes gracilis TaxID=150966 RepID=A0AAD3XN70_NEPGR|nr:hypothetical protein Nepgr_012251 [Nepenthes gracilis]
MIKGHGDEISSLHENCNFELAELFKGKRVLKNKRVFQLKMSEDSMQSMYKARLVVKGFNQYNGVDFDEIFAPVVKMAPFILCLI